MNTDAGSAWVVVQATRLRGRLGKRNSPGIERILALLAGGTERHEGLGFAINKYGILGSNVNVVLRFVDKRAKRYSLASPVAFQHHPEVGSWRPQPGSGNGIKNSLAACACREADRSNSTSPRTLIDDARWSTQRDNSPGVRGPALSAH